MITIEPIDNSYQKGFTVKGHAEYAPLGSDIVCAGISTATRMAYNSLSLVASLTINFANGNAYVQLHNVSDTSDTIIQGFLDTVIEFQEQYPEHVKLREDTWYVKR